MDTDTSESGLIETAYRHMDKDRPAKAFFCLAVEAVKQLTRLANDTNEIKRTLAEWSEDGTLSVTTHRMGGD